MKKLLLKRMNRIIGLFSLNHLLVFGMSLLLSLLFTPYARKIFLKKRNTTKYNSRTIHNKVITSAGGISIYVSFLITMVVILLLGKGWMAETFSSSFLKIMLSGTAMFILGLYDDFKHLSAHKKLIFQILVALFLVIIGVKIELGWLGIPLTIFWIVYVTNAINMIDGLDGLATGIVTFASLFLSLTMLSTGNIALTFFYLCLCGSALGFLKYNFYPAKIFMGNSGSHFLGFMISAASVYASQKTSFTNAFIIPIIVLGIPLIDPLSVVIHRLIIHSGIFTADRSHIHHRLLNLGFSQRNTVLLLYAGAILLGVLVFCGLVIKDFLSIFLFIVALSFTIFILFPNLKQKQENFK